VRILFFSDLRLGSGADPLGSLSQICSLARENDVDVVCSGGNLFESDLDDDTLWRVRNELLGLAPTRVLLAPGAKDWWHPGSPYVHLDQGTVHVFTEPHLTRVVMEPGVNVWGAAHRSSVAPNFLDEFVAGPPDEIHLALFYGGLREEFDLDPAIAPFTASDIRAAGLTHVLAGQSATPRHTPLHTSPGSGERGASIVTVSTDGTVDHLWRGFSAPNSLSSRGDDKLPPLPEWATAILGDSTPPDIGDLLGLPVWSGLARDLEAVSAGDRPRVLRALVLAMRASADAKEA